MRLARPIDSRTMSGWLAVCALLGLLTAARGSVNLWLSRSETRALLGECSISGWGCLDRGFSPGQRGQLDYITRPERRLAGLFARMRARSGCPDIAQSPSVYLPSLSMEQVDAVNGH